MMILFLMGLGYIKVQTEIKKKSYVISQKISKIEELRDEKYSLLYRFYKYASLDTENMGKRGYNFSTPQRFVRIEVPRVYKSEVKGFAFVRKIFSVGATAQAKE